MRKILRLTTGALAVLALASCTSSTPATRIANNRAKFEALPAKHQRLVEQGQLAQGMSPDAVLLAWGNPESRSEGSSAGVPVMTWTYTGFKPIYNAGFYGGYGWGGYGGYGGYGRYGRYGYPYFGVSPQVAYVPEDQAAVYFRNYKVHSWQRKQ